MLTSFEANAPVPGGPVPFEDVKAGLAALVPPERDARGENNDEILSTLPSKVADYSKLYCYKRFWLPEVYVTVAAALEQRFQPRPDDVIVASFPKCGTTWVMALLVAIMMRRACPPGAADHPLRRLNPHECVPFREVLFADGEEAVPDALPSPRLAMTCPTGYDIFLVSTARSTKAYQ
ncbi:hypothetical protein QOZ80_6AG0522740 [Eleusine coracana subsp. coracana]|nr:hypothetical protein QOZ80_6AG0522740 [Eleusine coracana subsp. coracana]